MNLSSRSLNLRDGIGPPWGKGSLPEAVHGCGGCSRIAGLKDPRDEHNPFPSPPPSNDSPRGRAQSPRDLQLLLAVLSRSEALRRTRGCPCAGTHRASRGLLASPDGRRLPGRWMPIASPSLHTRGRIRHFHLQHGSRCPLQGTARPPPPPPNPKRGGELRSASPSTTRTAAP